MPLANASHERARTATGWPKKNGSSRPVVVSAHQSRNRRPARPAGGRAARAPKAGRPERSTPHRPAARRPPAPRRGGRARGPVQGQEAVGHPDLGHVARAGQGDRVLADDPAAGPAESSSTRSESEIASSRSWVMNRTRLAVRGPQVEEHVLHQVPGLHVECRERLVHQRIGGSRISIWASAQALAHPARHLVRVAVARSRPGPPAPATRSPARAPPPAPRPGPRARPRRSRAPSSRHQRVRLEEVAGAAVGAGERLAENPDLAGAGAERPAATFSSVDLPDPVGPTIETNSPGARAREASLTAV